MLLAVYLAKEVADDGRTAHLLCSNYWVQPIFQELLHSSSRYNATRTGQRNRPSSGLARISAYPRPPKKSKPSASSTRFTDWMVFAVLILCKCGFLPIGPLWYSTSYNTRRMPTELPTHLGWCWSNRPKNGMKDELRTDGDPIAWRLWSTAQNWLWQLLATKEFLLRGGTSHITAVLWCSARSIRQQEKEAEANR